jgi:histidine kinase
MIILEFLASVLYILLVVVSTMVPTIYLGAQISPEFYKKRYWIIVFFISLSTRQTFGELFHIGILLFFYCIFLLVLHKRKVEALFLSLYLFLFFQSIRYLFVTIWLRILSGESWLFLDEFSTLYISIFDLLSIFLCCKIMKRWSLDLDLFFQMLSKPTIIRVFSLFYL